jgi:cholesterol transport system auxiliary component
MRRKRHRRAGPRAGLLALALGGCATLQPSKEPPPRLYVLEAAPGGRGPGATAGAPAILVAEPRARAGYDTPAMIYRRRPHEVESYAKSQWADPPARMLAPLLVQSLEAGGRFQAVPAASGVAAGVRLDTEIEELLQDFTVHPSRIRFALRAQIVDLPARAVASTRVFEALEDAPSDDPYGGVVAANRAVAHVLGDLSEWCGVEVRSINRRTAGGWLAP